LGIGLLFTLAGGATLAAWSRDARVELMLAAGACALGAWSVRRLRQIDPVVAAALAAIALWGLGQLAAGTTVYRHATLYSALRFTALAAFAVTARWLLSGARRERFLACTAWFGGAVAGTGVLAYYTSPGRVLWAFPAPYPDVWGVFLSRNHFAQFLELTLPVALWVAVRRRSAAFCLLAASMLAAGLASASRAGAALLIAETAAGLAVLRARVWPFPALALGLALAAGGGYLLDRLDQPDPYRGPIMRSAVDMIAARPWFGWGLGAFADAYPEFARFDAGRTVDHAHSDWLEWAAEGGLPFLALWAVLAARVARAAAASVWGLGVAAVFLHALVDYPFARMGVAAWVFVLAGALPAAAGTYREKTGPADPLNGRRRA
jgi:O-antigen ligase